uniref:Transposase n=1 Tax=Streptomyces sp. NBC_01401 TaxID=2903854 RepID=A0AAU3GZ26_9ACTN
MADLSFYISPLSEGIREEGRAEGRAQGRAEGRVQGRAESVLLLLGARGVDVADAARERVAGCTDPELVRQWLVRAVSVTTAEAIFGEE